MDLKKLMSGMAVVIDDALDPGGLGEADGVVDDINDIVALFETEWRTPFYRSGQMPPEDVWDNLLTSASFVLLDWKLWQGTARELERHGIAKNLAFLTRAKDYSVPVLIFTNEDPEDIAYKLEQIYEGESLKRSFVFVQPKHELLANGSLNLDHVRDWVMGNASVYVLKKWDQLFRAARRTLFSAMYTGSPDWPRVFWRSYEEDDVDPGLALTEMINDSLRGRMQANAFDEGLPNTTAVMPREVPMEQLRALIAATCFVDGLGDSEPRCGDLFKHRGKYLLNIRPDCDCIVRDNGNVDDVQLYCIEGTKLSDRKLEEKYDRNLGHLIEGIGDAIAFSLVDGRSIWFAFRKLRVMNYGELKNGREGRLLHPYLTRIQQRYALFLQRQGLPRIPADAVVRETAASPGHEEGE